MPPSGVHRKPELAMLVTGVVGYYRQMCGGPEGIVKNLKTAGLE